MINMYEIIRMNDTGKKYIVVGMTSREDMASCAYDRVYKCIPYEKQKELTLTNKTSSTTLEVRRTTKLPFTVSEKREYRVKSSVEYTDERGYKTKEINLKRVKKAPPVW